MHRTIVSLYLFMKYMKDKIRDFLEFPQKYLKWVGFNLKEKKARFVKRLFVDGITALVYSAVSVISIMTQQANLTVLGLNSLCLFRALISNTISASEVTRKIKNSDIEDQSGRCNHYHMKAAALTIAFIYTVIVFVLFHIGSVDGMASWVIRAFAALAIVAVFLNDLENIYVCAYDAIIEPIKK